MRSHRSVTPFNLFVSKIHAPYNDSLALEVGGYAKHMNHMLATPRTCVLNGASEARGGPFAKTQDVLDRCFGHLQGGPHSPS